MTDPTPLPTALLAGVSNRLPGASVHAWHDDRIDGTHYNIEVGVGVSFDVSDEAAFRSPLAIETAFSKGITALEHEALARPFAAALTDRDQEAAARLASAEDRIGRARHILADHLTRPVDREVMLARLVEVLR